MRKYSIQVAMSSQEQKAGRVHNAVRTLNDQLGRAEQMNDILIEKIKEQRAEIASLKQKNKVLNNIIAVFTSIKLPPNTSVTMPQTLLEALYEREDPPS